MLFINYYFYNVSSHFWEFFIHNIFSKSENRNFIWKYDTVFESHWVFITFLIWKIDPTYCKLLHFFLIFHFHSSNTEKLWWLWKGIFVTEVVLQKPKLILFFVTFLQGHWNMSNVQYLIFSSNLPYLKFFFFQNTVLYNFSPFLNFRLIPFLSTIKFSLKIQQFFFNPINYSIFRIKHLARCQRRTSIEWGFE